MLLMGLQSDERCFIARSKRLTQKAVYSRLSITGPKNMPLTHPFPVSFSTHSSVVLSLSTSSMDRTISSRFFTLTWFVLNRSSFAHSVRLKTSGEQSNANCVSFPAESMINESLVVKTW